ncbi:F0F1 ATP synthase subunit B family protein [Rhizorhapis sp. SPR117]|uniref:F0F1 ATP synthase subunit B family protein n=1 Tax=Rhizorhapis sp. SPR117 TaxID=2912611 RepID=UPI001F3E43D8|nr:F0F1 ATP synthase subunit B [Rhizorhapis sp. SPR117]
MLIDWFTVGAQALNFLILVWLLKRFLYRPILDAVDAREKRIAAELADADAKKAQAQEERDLFLRKNEQFDQQRAAIMNKAMDEAKAERQRLLEEARAVADALSAKRQEALRTEAHNLNDAIRRRTQQEVFAIARKALTDLAAVSLEDRVTEVFVQRLRAMDSKTKQAFAKTFETVSRTALLRSAFDFSAEQRAAIQQVVEEAFSADVLLRFETVPDVVSGIELIANGQKIAWSIADYLASMDRAVGELLQEQDVANVKAAPNTRIEIASKAGAPDSETQHS